MQIAGSHFHGPTTIQAGVSEETVQKILETHASERSTLRAQLDSKDSEVEELRDALARVQHQADAGDQQANAALEAARSTGEAGGLLSVLEDRADKLIGRVESGAETLKNDTEEFIAVSREIAATAYLVGDIDKAERSTQAILKLLPNDLASINLLGHLQFLRGELTAAEQHYERVLRLADSDAVRAVAYGNLGSIYQTRGELDRAEQMHRKSLAIDEELGRKEGMAGQYGNLGVIYWRRGELDRAERMHQKSLAINQELGRKKGMAIQYGNLGLIYQTRGELDRAEQKHQKSLAIEEELGWKEGMASTYGNLGIVYEDRGDPAKAREYWIRSRDLFTEIGIPHMVEKAQGWIDGLSDDEE